MGSNSDLTTAATINLRAFRFDFGLFGISLSERSSLTDPGTVTANLQVEIAGLSFRGTRVDSVFSATPTGRRRLALARSFQMQLLFQVQTFWGLSELGTIAIRELSLLPPSREMWGRRTYPQAQP